MKIKRRDFLKMSAATGLAVAAFKGTTLNALAEAPKGTIGGEKAGKWMASTCQGCTTWCPIEIFVQEGRATKVRGNQLSKANDGCAIKKATGDCIMPKEGIFTRVIHGGVVKAGLALDIERISGATRVA